jgi:hypothetical protein
LAQGAPHLAEAVAWLEMVGRKQAQEAFNALKGSIAVGVLRLKPVFLNLMHGFSPSRMLAFVIPYWQDNASSSSASTPVPLLERLHLDFRGLR